MDEEDGALRVPLHPRSVLRRLRRAHRRLRRRLAPHRPAFLDPPEHHVGRDPDRRGLLADVGVRRSRRRRQRRRSNRRGEADRPCGRAHRRARRSLQDRPGEHQGYQHTQSARLHPGPLRPQRRSQGHRRIRREGGPAGSGAHRQDGQDAKGGTGGGGAGGGAERGPRRMELDSAPVGVPRLPVPQDPGRDGAGARGGWVQGLPPGAAPAADGQPGERHV
mmetsp:Transcript_12893/g.58188  ORF Transcript_12893/g.58188 Transcript_12893/m.58188 type:complete len:220 (+) Transcript_12893:618-1277(+)